VFFQKIGEGFVRQLLKRRHPIAAELLEPVERGLVEFDQFAHDRVSLPGSGSPGRL